MHVHGCMCTRMYRLHSSQPCQWQCELLYWLGNRQYSNPCLWFWLPTVRWRYAKLHHSWLDHWSRGHMWWVHTIVVWNHNFSVPCCWVQPYSSVVIVGGFPLHTLLLNIGNFASVIVAAVIIINVTLSWSSIIQCTLLCILIPGIACFNLLWCFYILRIIRQPPFSL